MSKLTGKNIRYYRLKSNMTQSDLAEGIISISYLSKIENGRTKAPSDILNLLSERLNINPTSQDNELVYELCEKWIKSILRREIEKSKILYQEIIINRDNITHTPLLNIIGINKLQYFILTKQKSEANNHFSVFKKAANKFDETELYYWLKVSGNYFFSKGSYKKAYELYLKAEKHLNSGVFYLEEEKSDLFYMIANTSSKLRILHHVEVYANRALDHYQANYQLERCAECHILLGIYYQRINEIDKSVESFQLANTIAQKIGNDVIIYTSFQNVGNTYSVLNKTDEAIQFYTRSFELRSSSLPVKQIIPVSSLMKEYYKIGDLISAKQWLEIGLELSQDLNPSDSVYVYEFLVYKHLIGGIERNAFEALILKQVLPFLEEQKLYNEMYIYLKILAKYYNANRRYKLAAHYFEYASDILTNIYKE